MSHLLDEEPEYTITRVFVPKRKRHRIEIFLDVLQAMEDGEHAATRIMYKSNLSWEVLMPILKTLNHQKLILVIPYGERKFYFITEKGEKILRYFAKAKDIIITWVGEY